MKRTLIVSLLLLVLVIAAFLLTMPTPADGQGFVPQPTVQVDHGDHVLTAMGLK